MEVDTFILLVMKVYSFFWSQGPSFRGAPSAVKNFVNSSGCSMEGAPPKKETVLTVLGRGTILKLLWGRSILEFPGFGDLQP